MPGANREQWIAILEAASSCLPDEMEDEWEWLMDELAVPFHYFPAVLEGIRQGRWRQAKNPKAYLKTIARREAVKLGLTEAPAKELVLVPPRLSRTDAPASQGDVLDELIRAGERAALKRSDGVWRSGSGLEERDEREDWEEEFDSAWEYFLSKLPPDLKRQKEPNAETIQVFRSNQCWPGRSLHTHAFSGRA